MTEKTTTTYTLALNVQPSANVTITPSSTDIAIATTSGALTFTQANFATPQTVTINGVIDADADNASVSIINTLSGLNTGYDNIAVQDIHATVNDVTYFVIASNTGRTPPSSPNDYTKIDANGYSLDASASNWSCVKDNVTGFIWEVKTSSSGIHNKDDTYAWGNWDVLVDGSNTANFCGSTGWRVPSVSELRGIIDRSWTNPAININYFPNTVSAFNASFWSSQPRSTTTAW